MEVLLIFLDNVRVFACLFLVFGISIDVVFYALFSFWEGFLFFLLSCFSV